jgi:hypothetical protein
LELIVMKRRLFAWALSLLISIAPVSAQMMSTGIGGGGAGGAPAGSPYTGPLDVSSVGTAKACLSLRACSSALRGTKAINACNSTGGGDVCADLLTDASTGNLVSQSINSGTCPGANCTIKIWYDQPASGACTGSCDHIQNTVANRATLDASCSGALPCASFSNGSGSGGYATAGNITLAQPFTISTAYIANASAIGGIMATNGASSAQLFFPCCNFISAAAGGSGGDLNVPATYGTSHAVQATFNGASTLFNVDGSSTNGDATHPGTNGLTAGQLFFSTGPFSGSPALSKFFEIILYAGAQNSTVQNAACHNQFLHWGTATSC